MKTILLTNRAPCTNLWTIEEYLTGEQARKKFLVLLGLMSENVVN